jgi:outer membrane protein
MSHKRPSRHDEAAETRCAECADRCRSELISGTGRAILAVACYLALVAVGRTETLNDALISAYQVNPQLNAQRASVRASDEAVPQALSGYRPTVNLTVSSGFQYLDYLTQSDLGPLGLSTTRTTGHNVPTAVTGNFSQGLLNPLTPLKVRQAESSVSAARQALRVLEQTVLLSAATAYLDVLRDAEIVVLQRQNIRVLEETLRQTADRKTLGEANRTDVAQAAAQRAAAVRQLASAESSLLISQANYRRIIGKEPRNLSAAPHVDRLLPAGLGDVLAICAANNPAVRAAAFGVDVNFLQTKINEGALLPVVTLQGSAQQYVGATSGALGTPQSLSVNAGANLTVPVYQGGAEYALIRQSKESLAQQQLTLHQTMDQARSDAMQAWGQLRAAKTQLAAAEIEVGSAQVASNGVAEEARIGQRTTLDVLISQQTLVTAQIARANAKHDRIVGSYAVLAGIGGLSPITLGLQTMVYDPSVHYHQVRDSWIGIRGP